MSAGGDKAPDERRLEMLIDIAGLQETFAKFPVEVREACELARTYVALLPAEVAPGVAPWTFPSEEAGA
jgi:hypothetical protein